MGGGGFQHALEIEDLTKRYGSVAALDRVSLDVRAGEFLTLLGPSGSGKTTLLMAVAGFVAPSSGDLRLDGRSILALPPERRHFGMVFQGYALFPHMSVAKNVAFPLEVRGRPAAQVARAVTAALDLVQLGHLAPRLPRQLSGGQQQRVALARALVFEPHLLLLDEPLSALDRKLRVQVQLELRDLHRRVGRTFVYVTHDQDEALSMSDRIAVMRDGRIVQVDAPRALYERPRTRFVAEFLGRSNVLRGRVESRDGAAFAYRCGGLRLVQSAPAGSRLRPGDAVTLALRPERVELLRPGDAAANAASGRVAGLSYLGAQFHLVVAVDGLGEVAAVVPARADAAAPGIGEAVTLGWDEAACALVEDDVIEDGDAVGAAARAPARARAA